MAHAQEPDFVFRAKRTSPFKSAGGRQFSRLLAAEVCASAIVMLDTPCSEVVWRVLATHCIRQFPLHLSSRASPCAITFQPESTAVRQPLPSMGAPLLLRDTNPVHNLLLTSISFRIEDPLFNTEWRTVDWLTLYDTSKYATSQGSDKTSCTDLKCNPSNFLFLYNLSYVIS